MQKHPISELLERTLVIVAHADDECIAAGALLQRIQSTLIVFCTDGAPDDDYFWRAYGTREKYAQVRQAEAISAAEAIECRRAPIFLPIIDQELYLNLATAFQSLKKHLSEFRPEAIFTLAYEGGHPDHDCCAFLGWALGIEHRIPVWETPLYHQANDGRHRQKFLFPADETCRLEINACDIAKKQRMAACYQSQASVLGSFDLTVESFRPQFPYDFSQPPATDVINYETWRWPMTAQNLCSAFDAFQREHVAVKPQRIA